MAIPIRIEFSGALYHVTARGDRREAIYDNDADREAFLEVLGQVVVEFNWICHAYCRMTHHYRLVIETRPSWRRTRGVVAAISRLQVLRGKLYHGRAHGRATKSLDYRCYDDRPGVDPFGWTAMGP